MQLWMTPRARLHYLWLKDKLLYILVLPICQTLTGKILSKTYSMQTYSIHWILKAYTIFAICLVLIYSLISELMHSQNYEDMLNTEWVSWLIQLTHQERVTNLPYGVLMKSCLSSNATHILHPIKTTFAIHGEISCW